MRVITIPQLMVMKGTNELAISHLQDGMMVRHTPYSWRQVLESHICRHFKYHVGDEENGQSYVVIFPRHVQIFFKTGKPRIANIASVFISQ